MFDDESSPRGARFLSLLGEELIHLKPKAMGIVLNKVKDIEFRKSSCAILFQNGIAVIEDWYVEEFFHVISCKS